MKHFCRVVLPLLLVALPISSLSSLAQSSPTPTPEPRIRGAINGTSREVLANSRTPRVRDADDLGPLASNTVVPGITLVFKRSDTQEADLQQLLAAQQDTASPRYHQWLTPETFAARFGVAEEDITATQTWLTSHGFHIDRVSRSRDRITFSGTAAQVQSAFGTELHHYRTAEGETHFAPAADLTLPAELAPVTAAVLHLSDFRPKPNIKVQTHPHPDYTTLSTQTHYLSPADLGMMYDMNGLLGNFVDGRGQSIALVGQSYVDTTSPASTVTAFREAFGSLNPVNQVLVPGTGVEAISPGDEGESEIDLEYSTSVAFQVNVFLVFVGANQNNDVFDALAYAITENIAPVVSISYSICEPLMSTTDLNQSNALFEEASAQGQTLIAAAGDSGSTACAFNPSSQVTVAQQQALSVNFPASSPSVTALGGTQMAPGTFAPGASTYWSSASNFDSVYSLLSYVPEVVWNEDSASNGIAAGGGGTSSYFTRPTWQTGVPGIPAGNFRLLPDIALQSSIASPGFLICSDDPSLTGSQSTGCAVGGQNVSKYTVAGGTSFAAPVFAGMVALLNQTQQTQGQGNINPILYRLAANPATYASAFHDITSGTNACTPPATTCSAANESSYAATPGYDQATGLGSVDFDNLVTAWPKSNNTTLQPTFIQISTGSTIAPGQTVQMGIDVIAEDLPNHFQTSTTPTGTVSVSIDGTVVDSAVVLPASMIGAYNFTAPTAPGSHLITVTYPGDALHTSSAQTAIITIGNLTATGNFTVTAGSLTVASGSTGSTQIAAISSGGYTGRVVWSLAASTTSTSATQTVCYWIGQPTTSNFNAEKLTIGAGAACSAVSPDERPNFRTINPSVASKQETSSSWRETPQFALYAGLILCGSLAGRRRKIRLSLLLALASLACITTVLTGCSGSGGGGTAPPPTSASATIYTLTLTGTDSVNTAITASTNFTLTVN